jgi:hypothetical protein
MTTLPRRAGRAREYVWSLAAALFAIGCVALLTPALDWPEAALAGLAAVVIFRWLFPLSLL